MFSIIRKGRQQAKEHTAKVAEKTKDEEAKKPYKHVPTHAALDAMAGTPSSWRDEERPRILEQHRRRSAMGTNLVHTKGYPRDNTSTPYISYSSSYNYSYSGTPVLRPQSESRLDYYTYQSSRKGKEPEWIPPMAPGVAVPMTPSGRASALSSRGTAKTNSSGASVGSEDDLEMKSRKSSTKAGSHGPPPSSFSRPIPSRTNSSESGSLHHLHPAHQRKTSGSDRYYPPAARSTHFTKPQPIDPRTIRNDPSIPPVPSLPTLHFDQTFEHTAASHSDSKSASSVSSSSSARNSAHNSGSTAPSSLMSKTNHNSTSSFASLQQNTTDSVITAKPQQPAQTEVVLPVEARQPRSEQVSKPGRRRLSKSRRPSETDIDTHQWGPTAPSSSKPGTDAAATAAKSLDPPAPKATENDSKKPLMPKITRRLSKTQRDIQSPEPQAVPKEKKRWTFLGLKRNSTVTA
ncbi:hypothetical protein PG989_006024 [Apiospora arundinis]|uniref:Uncharacterized protein n=1 Tax=Apiospora arundinis TaxID=335852 RepID=A0ABR2IUV8_9PEZI